VLKRDFPDIDVSGVDIVLVEAVRTVLSSFAAGLGRRAEAALRRKGVRILFDHLVSEVRDGEVVFASGDRLAAATMIWTAGVSAEAPEGMEGVERAAQGRIRVSPSSLELIGHPTVYAVGDVAACPGPGGRPLPMVAPVAIQQGDQVARVIAARTRGEADPPPFHYRDRGSMATVGRNVAVAQIGPLRLSGLVGWMAWLFVHLMSLVSFRNRLLVLIGWAWNYVFYDRPVRLIVSPTPPSEIAGGGPTLP
jgi:NADH dehydrogenase